MADDAKAKDTITSGGQETRTAEAFQTSQKYRLRARETPAGVTGMDEIGKKFPIQQPANDVAPPGWGGTVEKMSEDPSIKTPSALAWWMKGKGYTPHK
jgi:aminoglycoside phosphotransferase (APT) family kinase protein